jgi:hypothetical protein
MVERQTLQVRYQAVGALVLHTQREGSAGRLLLR